MEFALLFDTDLPLAFSINFLFCCSILALSRSAETSVLFFRSLNRSHIGRLLDGLFFPEEVFG
jgi:hypothetical protein